MPDWIDATGDTDASEDLNDWLESVPSGSTVSFPARSFYRMDRALSVTDAQDLTLLGNGATLLGRGDSEWTSSVIVVSGGQGVVIHGFTLEGNSPTPGTLIFGDEYAHGIFVVDSENVEISGVTIAGVWGDGVAIEDWADGVWFHDSRVKSAGRNGVAILAGANITIERVAFDQTGGSVLDIEPWQASGGARNVMFRDNTGGTRGETDPDWGIGLLFGANGAEGSTVDGVTVTRTRLTGSTITANVAHVSRRSNIVFTDNVSEVIATSGPYGGPVLDFANIDGLTVARNTQPLSPGADLLDIWNSTEVSTDIEP